MAVPQGYRPIAGSERRPAPGASRVRPADPDERLSVTVHLRRPPGVPPLPDLAYWAATPLNQRRYLTRAEFAAQQGAAPGDIGRVEAFGRAHGLTATDSSAARRTVVLSGTVAQMEAAFGVELGHYETPDESYRGREGLVYVPEDIHDIVEGVLGLDNRRVARHHLAFGGAGAPGTGPAGASPLTPTQVAQLYNFPTNPAAGQTIGIIELGGGYAQTDINAFFNGLGLIPPVLTDVSVDGATNSPAGNINNVTTADPDFEVALDIDVAGAVAQKAAIAVYFAPNTEQGFADAVKTAVLDTANAPSILSISWSGSEDSWTAAGRTTMGNALADAAALGVTVFLDSGDWGSDGNVGNGSAHVLYPTSELGVTGCGGTYIANVQGKNFKEGTWNDDTGATGGGVSDVFLGLPSWQQGVGVPVSANDHVTVGRGVPDIAGNASPYSGYTLTVYGKPTTSLIITSGPGAGQALGTFGGTSAVAPLYAGLFATIEAALGNKPLGLLNSVLYGLAGSGVFRDINDGVNNQWSGEARLAPSYTSGPGWDACTGLGSIDGTALLNALKPIFAKSIGFGMDQTTFAQDDVEVQLPGVARFAPGWIQANGFLPSELLTGNDLNNPAATLTFSLTPPSLPPGVASAIQSMLSPPVFTPPVVPVIPSLPNDPQSFLFPFTLTFTGDGGYLAMKAAGLTSTFLTLGANLRVGQSNFNSAVQLELTTGEDPRFEDINPQNPTQYPSWLSFDLRFFRVAVAPGGQTTRFNANMTSNAADAPGFIAQVIGNLNSGNTGGDSFDPGLSQDEDASKLGFHQQDNSGNYVFNFAVARVRLLASKPATARTVRVFFRLFQAQNTASDFNTGTTYRFASDNANYGHKIALFGVQNDANGNPEYVTIPCFASARVNLNGAADMTAQADTPNAYDIPATPQMEVDRYFGCWIDNNQPGQQIFPVTPPAGDWDGQHGWQGATLISMYNVISHFPHQCLIAEIRFDDTPIPPGANSGNSDKLAQRNIAWIDGPSGTPSAARRMAHPVQLRPTPKASFNPDEVMILWDGTPPGSQAELYLPAFNATDILRLADSRYSRHQLGLVDAHTVGFPSGGATFIPLPEAEALAAGLLTVNLPPGAQSGASYSIAVRQLTDAAAAQPPPPPQIQIAAAGNAGLVAAPAVQRWRKVLGGFQFNIVIKPVEQLLLPEERLLALLRWIVLQMSPQKRWYPVLLRYLDIIVGRVVGFGGDPGTIEPSPIGDVPGLHLVPHPPRREEECEITGKIDAIIFDHFGDFEGFVLETESGAHHRFYSRETPMLALARRAWIERIRVTVCYAPPREHLPRRLLFRSGRPGLRIDTE